jgi:hypothetical protein
MESHLQHNPDLTSSVVFGLGWVYLLLFVMNAAWVRRSFALDGNVRLSLGGLLGKGQEIPVASLWAIYCAMLLMVGVSHLTGSDNAQSCLLWMPELL